MLAFGETGLMFALFNLGGGEIILVLALVLILFGARKLPDLAQGLGRGLFLFWSETKRARDALDDAASDAGRSVGGIYGKAAAQALTPDNQVAELYDPAVLKDKRHPPRPSRAMVTVMKFLSWMRRLMCVILGLDIDK